MSQFNRNHQDDRSSKVLSFGDRVHNISLSKESALDPLEELLTEFDHLENEFKDEKEELSSLDRIETKLQDLASMTLAQKSELLHEIIQRSQFYMSDLEFYLDKSS